MCRNDKLPLPAGAPVPRAPGAASRARAAGLALLALLVCATTPGPSFDDESRSVVGVRPEAAAWVAADAWDVDPAALAPPAPESPAAPPATFDAASAAAPPSEARDAALSQEHADLAAAKGALDRAAAAADAAPAVAIAAPDAAPAGRDGAAAGAAPSPRKKGARTPRQQARHRAKTNVPWDQQTRPILYAFPPAKKRLDLIKHLEALPAFATGVEVGVGTGMLAKATLEIWDSSTEYKLVDAGENQDRLSGARYRVKKWRDKTEFLVLPPAAAADALADAHFDFAYLNLGQDYCTVMELMAGYWHKLRPGGILGGSGYAAAGPGEAWGTCEDGSVRPEATRGAVDDFRRERGGLDLYLSGEKVPSWYIQKPY